MSTVSGKAALVEEFRAAFEYANEAWLQRFEETSVRQWQSLNGVLLRGARAVPVGSSTGGTMRPSTSNGSLVGYALRETSGTPGAVASIELRQGADADGDVVLPITLAAGESVRDWFAPGGISFAEGMFVTITGDVDGAVFLRAGDT